MRKDGRVVAQAMREVQAHFPFPEYLQETADTVRSVATLLQGLAPAGSRLLDIGCGALDKTAVFHQMGYRCFGCDDFRDPWHRRRDNLDRLLAFAREMGVQVHVQGEDYAIPWERASFDMVTLMDVIEHLHEGPREILNFAGTYLKPGGLLVVIMPNSVNLRKRLAVLLGRTNYPSVRGFYEYIGLWRGHVREYTLPEACQIVQWTGFDLVEKTTFHGLLARRLRLPILRLLYKALCVPFPGFRDSLFVVARKPAQWAPRQPDPGAMDVSLGEAVPRGVM